MQPTGTHITTFPIDADVDVDLVIQFIQAIIAERKWAHTKHGAKSMEQSGLLEHRRASILAEEAVECGRALNDHEHGAIHLFADCATAMGRLDAHFDELDKELIQTAAMAYTWWANRRGDRLDPIPETPAPEGMSQQPAVVWYGGRRYVGHIQDGTITVDTEPRKV